MKSNTPRIAIDGGPCSGKSTGMSYISRKLADVGIVALIVPEAATLLINSNIAPWTIGLIPFQHAVARLQLSNESVWLAEAEAIQKRTGKKCVLLCDRGLIGAAAYLPGDKRLESLGEILANFDIDIEKARTRYAGVIHMVTAANGAEEFYTLENNVARKETAAEARELDQRTMAAWLGHSHLAVISNIDREGKNISFEKKIHKAFSEVLGILGYPEPLEIEDKYLVEPFDFANFPVPYEVIDIKQTYLTPPEEGSEERVRMRKWLDSASYFHTIKRFAGKGTRTEIERIIGADEYERLLKKADPNKLPIKKKRHCFVWNAQYFEGDVFEEPHKGLYLLERERTNVNEATAIPPFIRVICDVTDDPAYKNGSLATISR